MSKLRVYLAGPDVFFDRPKERGERLKQLAADHGFEGLYPLDADLELVQQPSTPIPGQGRAIKGENARMILRANRAIIESADAVCANLLPFRGPSADVGTVWELGYAEGLGKLTVGYSYNRRTYAERVLPDNDQIEDFGLRDNLMFAAAMPIYDSPEQALDWVAHVFTTRDVQVPIDVPYHPGRVLGLRGHCSTCQAKPNEPCRWITR